VIPKPSWQQGTGCTNRATADVSAAALGIATYVDGAWVQQSGTSAAAPLVAGIYAETRLAGYDPSFSYYETDYFHDVVSGISDNSNGYYNPTTHARASCNGAAVCTVGSGWDGPTGNGTPNGATMASQYWSSTYKNSFEGDPNVPGTNASKWWFAGNAGIDVDRGFAIPGEQNDGWANAYSGWNAVNTWLPTTPGQACDVALWVRTSQSNFGTGYIGVDNEANTVHLGGVGPFAALTGDANFAGYTRVNFSFTATDTQSIFYAGFWGNGQDSWMQVNDLSMHCAPKLQPIDVTSYQTGVSLYLQGTGFANGPVRLWYHGVPGQSGWSAGATLQASNGGIAGSDATFEGAYVPCTAQQAAGYVNVIAFDSAYKESTFTSVRACEFCGSVQGQSSGGCQ
jgi:hypothetical protein